ncbi:uncharacterized protein EURHEDRAFT_417593 [Aspergillus ruber CBS 135680]|uniref:Uncharacterized protein n=1 Tax=Aspergillus ruber (strain CBS 135680) TaxID=1388766 RepID=A0A017RZS3_ASPRC|nr:uncharacterized protein EURHEDRAFT_417593 [Aspergillus ruber CBS 135680]EYE90293.1 hypothetical protein EURHEDRAFT_417593 [Aspergillus ruber CBS 135680]
MTAKAKLDCGRIVKLPFGHLEKRVLPKHHHHPREKLELFQNQTMEAKQKVIEAYMHWEAPRVRAQSQNTTK